MENVFSTPNHAADLFQSVDFSVEPVLPAEDVVVEAPIDDNIYKTPANPTSSISSNTCHGVWTQLIGYASAWEYAITETNLLVSNAITADAQIHESILQKKEEGSLSHLEYFDLKYISNSWKRLKICLSFYSVGARVHRRELISILLELFKLQQIPEYVVIDTLTQLC